MIKRKEIDDPQSCLNKARDDELVFVLLSRDVAAPVAIRMWVHTRLALGKNDKFDGQIIEALSIADSMEMRSCRAAGAATPALTAAGTECWCMWVNGSRGATYPGCPTHGDAARVAAAPSPAATPSAQEPLAPLTYPASWRKRQGDAPDPQRKEPTP